MRSKYDRAADDARVAKWHSTLTWTPFSERHPQPCEAVIVKMVDGRVVGAHWMDRGTWYHSPFEKRGEPVSWAKLPELHRSP